MKENIIIKGGAINYFWNLVYKTIEFILLIHYVFPLEKKTSNNK